jgi:WD40 repeat protein
MTTKRIAVIVGVALLVAGAAGAAAWQWRKSKPPARGTWSAVAPPAQKSVAVAGGRPELVLQTGHLAQVASVAFNPDSTLIASSSNDGTVKLWEIASRRELRSFPAPDGIPPRVAFSRDGQLVTAYGDRFRAWSVSTGKSTDTDLRPNWMAGSPDGQWRAGETDAGLFLSQDAALGGATHELPRIQPNTHLTPVFSPDGRWLAVEEDQQPPNVGELSGLPQVRAAALGDSVEATISLWEVGTWRAVATIPGRRPLNADPVFSPDGKWVAVIADGRRQVEIWDAAQGKQVRVLHTPMRVSLVLFSPDSLRVVTTADSYIEFVGRLDETANKNAQDAADPDASVILWDLSTNAAPRTINAGTEIETVAFSADSRKLGVAGGHGVMYWNLDAESAPVVIESGKSESVSFSADNQRIAWATGSDVKMRNVASEAEVVVMSAPLMPVDFAMISPDGRWLATANHDFDSDISGRVRLWDIATGREAHTLAADAPSLRSMIFSPDGRRLITFGEEIAGWDTSSGQTLDVPSDLGPPPPFHLASRDGRTMAFGPMRRVSCSFRLPTRRRPRRSKRTGRSST